jgi:hypothetical protein
MKGNMYTILGDLDRGNISIKNAQEKLIVLHNISGSYMIGSPKACKVCSSYNKNTYPLNKICINKCSAFNRYGNLQKYLNNKWILN